MEGSSGGRERECDGGRRGIIGGKERETMRAARENAGE